jgi:hypothetical protein
MVLAVLEREDEPHPAPMMPKPANSAANSTLADVTFRFFRASRSWERDHSELVGRD